MKAEDIFEDLEILILQNEDDFDRGSGKFILRKFIKEKQAEQLNLTDVSQQRELLIEAFDLINIHDGDRAKIGKLIDLVLKSINCGYVFV